MQDLAQVATHPQTRAGGMVQTSAGLESVAAPLQVDGRRLEHLRSPPLLGEHTDEIMSELGYSAADVARLRERGVVGSER